MQGKGLLQLLQPRAKLQAGACAPRWSGTAWASWGLLVAVQALWHAIPGFRV